MDTAPDHKSLLHMQPGWLAPCAAVHQTCMLSCHSGQPARYLQVCGAMMGGTPPSEGSFTLVCSPFLPQ